MNRKALLGTVGFLGLTVSLAGVVGCQVESADTESFENLQAAYTLRGDLQMILEPGTEVDEDELASRNGYATTLYTGRQEAWLARVETASPETLSSLGLHETTAKSARVLLGTVATEAGPDCQVLVEGRPDQYLVLSRPQGSAACPASAADLEPWLPLVSAISSASDPEVGVAQQALVFGSYVGTFNGVDAYSNGSTGYNSGAYSCCGLKWQCVEYVNRYYHLYLGHQNLKGTGNANDYFGTAAAKGLVAHPNTNAVKPAVNDMLVSNGGLYGHIAIVREVGATYVKIIQQNWANDASDDSKTLTMTYSNGSYTVAGFSASYPVKGWLRKQPNCAPQVSSVTPLTATLNQSKTFTVSGSCLPSTLAPWIADCANLVVNSVSSSQAKFTCTPSWTTGTKSGVVKDKSGGTTLKSFSLTVQ